MDEYDVIEIIDDLDEIGEICEPDFGSEQPHEQICENITNTKVTDKENNNDFNLSDLDYKPQRPDITTYSEASLFIKQELNNNLTIDNNNESNKSKFECDTCHDEFYTGSSLAFHKRYHCSDKPYKCGTCRFRFGKPEDLMEHKTECFENKIPHACSTCRKTFSSENELYVHQLIHVLDKPYECALCDEIFYRPIYFRKHYAKRHPLELGPKCGTCHELFENWNDYHRHVTTAHSNSMCEICGQIFRWKCELKKHIRTTHPSNPLKCTVCHRPFRFLGSLRSHMEKTHNLKYECKVSL